MSTLSNPSYVSTAEVSAALGVSISTVKRWVDDGILPAHKTAGGHRKLLLADVLELVRRENMPHADVSRLVPHKGRQKPSLPAAQTDALYRALLAGDRELVRSIIHTSYRQGLSVERLADEVVAPAMRRVGHDWEEGRIDVMHEHRGTQLCSAALYELKAVLEARATKNRPVAVGGAPERDYSLLPTLLAQMTLLDAGWEAVNLGPNTPLASFAKAVVELRPRLLWLSISHLEAGEAFFKDYRKLYRQAEQAGVAVALGGQALVEPIRAMIPYTTFGDGLTHLAAFARTLHPRPQRPRRGRPRSP